MGTDKPKESVVRRFIESQVAALLEKTRAEAHWRFYTRQGQPRAGMPLLAQIGDSTRERESGDGHARIQVSDAGDHPKGDTLRPTAHNGRKRTLRSKTR